MPNPKTTFEAVSYIESLSDPSMLVSPPSLGNRPHVLRSQSVTYNNSVGTSTGLYIFYPNHPFGLVGFHVPRNSTTLALIPNAGTLITLPQNLEASYDFGRKIAGMLELKSSSLPSGVFALSGTFNAVVLNNQLSEIASTAQNKLLSLNTDPMSRVANALVLDGVVITTIPRNFDEPMIRLSDPVTLAINAPQGTYVAGTTQNQAQEDGFLYSGSVSGSCPTTAPTSGVITLVNVTVPVDSTTGASLKVGGFFTAVAAATCVGTMSVNYTYQGIAGTNLASGAIYTSLENFFTNSWNYPLTGFLTNPLTFATLTEPIVAINFQVQLTGATGATYTFSSLQLNFEVEVASGAYSGVNAPVVLVGYEGVAVGTTLTLGGLANYELLPNAGLMQNVELIDVNADVDEVEKLRVLINARDRYGLRELCSGVDRPRSKAMVSALVHGDEGAASSFGFSDLLAIAKGEGKKLLNYGASRLRTYLAPMAQEYEDEEDERLGKRRRMEGAHAMSDDMTFEDHVQVAFSAGDDDPDNAKGNLIVMLQADNRRLQTENEEIRRAMWAEMDKTLKMINEQAWKELPRTRKFIHDDDCDCDVCADDREVFPYDDSDEEPQPEPPAEPDTACASGRGYGFLTEVAHRLPGGEGNVEWAVQNSKEYRSDERVLQGAAYRDLTPVQSVVHRNAEGDLAVNLRADKLVMFPVMLIDKQGNFSSMAMYAALQLGQEAFPEYPNGCEVDNLRTQIPAALKPSRKTRMVQVMSVQAGEVLVRLDCKPVTGHSFEAALAVLNAWQEPHGLFPDVVTGALSINKSGPARARSVTYSILPNAAYAPKKAYVESLGLKLLGNDDASYPPVKTVRQVLQLSQGYSREALLQRNPVAMRFSVGPQEVDAWAYAADEATMAELGQASAVLLKKIRDSVDGLIEMGATPPGIVSVLSFLFQQPRAVDALRLSIERIGDERTATALDTLNVMVEKAPNAFSKSSVKGPSQTAAQALRFKTIYKNLPPKVKHLGFTEDWVVQNGGGPNTAQMQYARIKKRIPRPKEHTTLAGDEIDASELITLATKVGRYITSHMQGYSERVREQAAEYLNSTPEIQSLIASKSKTLPTNEVLEGLLAEFLSQSGAVPTQSGKKKGTSKIKAAGARNAFSAAMSRANEFATMEQ